MAVPTKKQLEKWAEAYVRTWNEGDKEAWGQNYRDVAPGEFTMWDPVGTPPKHGFEHCALDSFDLFQASIRFHTPKETLFFNPGHVAWVMQNHHERDGKPIEVELEVGERPTPQSQSQQTGSSQSAP